MKITANNEGIVISKMFKVIVIPYGDIGKIVVESDRKTVIVTRAGEEYIDTSFMGVTFNYPVVADKIVELNIAFEDKFVVSDYSDTIIEEENKQEYVDSLLASFEPEASKMIKARLGERHDISLEVLDVHRDTVLCMRLLRDGVEVSDYHDSFKDYDDVKIREAFETQCLLMLCEWDPLSRSGRYIIALDNENFPDDNKAALLELVSEFCDGYLEVNSREYLDALP
ncbi:MAG: hypothetical protein J6Z05_10670 [Lachnospiraceae bacterium]|nr:hypothetical protein [Lachnospiraceae bacterium]